MSLLVNSSFHNNSRATKLTAKTFTKALIFGMFLIGLLAFASTALIPFREYTTLIEFAIVIAGPLAICAIWSKSYIEQARYLTYAYAIGFLLGMSMCGLL